MTVEEGQRQVRTTYLGGAPGQLVCAGIGLASAPKGRREAAMTPA
jgi:hypothetical protein